MKARFDHVEDYLEQAQNLQNSGFLSLRAQAAENLQTFGFPALKTEAWKYTNAKALLQQVYQPAISATVSAAEINTYLLADADYIVLVNGVLQVALSKFDNMALTLQSIEQVDAVGQLVPMAQPGFTALNTLLFQQGYALTIKKSLPKPLHILHVSKQLAADSVVYNRNQIHVAAGCVADVVEQFVSLDDAAYWQNTVAEVFLAPNADLRYYKLQQEAEQAHHTFFMVVQQASQSQFASWNVDLGGRLVRNDLQVQLVGEKAGCNLQGVYLLRDKQHVDNHTNINHVVARTYSKEHYKGILDDQAHGVFNGRVVVQLDAQKVDSNQQNSNLLLSDNCEIDTKPELEIYADDVKCAHGATVGQLDDTAIFYLQARGIDRVTAEKLLTFGFAYEIIEEMPTLVVRNFFTQHLAYWFVDDTQLQELLL